MLLPDVLSYIELYAVWFQVRASPKTDRLSTIPSINLPVTNRRSIVGCVPGRCVVDRGRV